MLLPLPGPFFTYYFAVLLGAAGYWVPINGGGADRVLPSSVYWRQWHGLWCRSRGWCSTRGRLGN